MNNNGNKKSQSKAKAGRGAQQSKQSQNKSAKPMGKRQGTFDPRVQNRSKKSPTGASYNDGFDVVNKPSKPKMRREDFDELVIAALPGSVGYTVTQVPLNPGQSTVFPRLSKFAQLYERYRFEKLEFYFQHDVSQFNSQGQSGLVIQSGLFDAASAAPTTKAQQEMTDPHVICMPNQNSLLRLDPARLHPQNVPLFVRPGNVPGGADIKTYDAGNVFVGTQGMAGTGEVGELHCRGTCCFYDEILDSSLISAPQNFSVSQFDSSSPETLTTGVTKPLVLGTVLANGLNVGINAYNFTPPAGNYIVAATCNYLFAGNNGTSVSSVLQKNGVNYGTATGETLSTGAFTEATTSILQFMSCNGTDVINLDAQGIFPSSTATCSGTLVLYAV